MLVNYHLHTEYSDDCSVPMETRVITAIEKGFDEICFTDHVDYGTKTDWNEPPKYFYMDQPCLNVNYPKYFKQINELKEKYKDKITIKTGLELGVQNVTLNEFNKLVERYGHELDFAILSVHQIDNQELWTHAYMMGKNQKEYTLGYYKEILDVASKFDCWDSLGHIDHIIRYETEPHLSFEKTKGILTEILKVVIEKGKGIEINTSSWRYGINDTTPSMDILKLYYDLGGRIITIGSDSHNIEDIDDGITKGIERLKEIGFTEFHTYEKHKPISHKL